MSVFKIKAPSRFIYELAFLAITFSGIFLGFYLGKTDGNDVYIFIVTLVGLPLVIFIPDLLSTAMSEWTFTEYGIHIKWLSRFLFNSKNDINIKWQDIQEYKYEPNRYFDLFRIKLGDQTIIKFWHSNYAIDDFHAFIYLFRKTDQ